MDTTQAKQRFEEHYRQLCSVGAFPQWLLERPRDVAMEEFARRGLPGPKEEDWRFTNLAPFCSVPFELASADGAIQRDLLERLLPYQLSGLRLVFVNGFYSPELSFAPKIPGVDAGSIAAVGGRIPKAAAQQLGRSLEGEKQPFALLNTAMFQDGAFVCVHPDVVLADPVQLVFVSTAGATPTVAYPRIIISAGARSKATVIETYIGLGDSEMMTNTVSEVAVLAEASLEYIKIQEETTRTFHFGSTYVYQVRDSQFAAHSIAFGARLARNNLDVVLDDRGANAVLNGLYLIGGHQQTDNYTRIVHAKPDCESHELYKGILDGHARGVFNGRIVVNRDAQKTNSKQTNKNLLLSKDALVNTNPQLEIFADDVKCTHGATIGQLDEEQVFYLRARGIGEAEARSVLAYAFANDIVGRIRIDPVREHLEKRLLALDLLPAQEVSQ